MAYTKSKTEGFWANLKEITILLLIVFLIRTFGFGLYQVPTGSMETTMLVGERFFADKFTPLFKEIKRGDIIAFNDPTFKYSDNKVTRLFQDYVWGPSNWTKRVVGQPGDEVKGVIENGKPVVYVNGKKLDEPYVNKYPLVQVWKVSKSQLQQMLQSGSARQYLGQYVNTKSYDPNARCDKQPFYNIRRDRIARGANGQPDLILPGTPIGKPSGGKVINGDNYWHNGDEFYVKLGKDQFWVMGDNRLGSHDSRYFGPITRNLIHGKILFRIWSVDSDENWWILDLFKNPIGFWKRVRWSRFFQVVR